MYIIKKNQGAVSKWSNGITREMFIYPQTAALKNRNFIFRVSSARIDSEHSVFSNFDGFIRYLIPLNADMQIKHEDRPYFLLKAHNLHCFAGDIKTESMHTCKQLIDFNVIIDKNYACDMQITKNIDMKNVPYIKYDIVLVYLLNATAMYNNTNLEKGDLLIIDERKPIDFSSNGGDLFIGKIKLS